MKCAICQKRIFIKSKTPLMDSQGNSHPVHKKCEKIAEEKNNEMFK